MLKGNKIDWVLYWVIIIGLLLNLFDNRYCQMIHIVNQYRCRSDYRYTSSIMYIIHVDMYTYILCSLATHLAGVKSQSHYY